MRAPKSITGIMAEEAARPKDSGAALVMAVLDLQRIWPEIVGELAAEHCRPAGFKKGVLTIASESPAWTQEMSMLSLDIQERIDDSLGQGIVTELRFKTARRPGPKKRPAPPKKKPAPSPKKTLKPPDPAQKARLEKELAGIEDPELREVLMRIRLATGG